MANTTFSGPVRSEGGFNDVSKNGTSGAVTTVRAATSAQITAGVGITTGVGVVYDNTVTQEVMGSVTHFTTRLYIDLTGLNSAALDDDIIGVPAGGAAHIGQVTAAANGTVHTALMKCLELPAGGDPNVALWSADEATGAHDTLITTLTETELLTSQGDGTDWAAGDSIALATLPAADQWLYLVQGDGTGTNGTYTAGIFLIEFTGTTA